ncbi:MAG: glycosyltransferase family 2 protein [Candidatus Accumulibacter meliphilus]|jgi:GT2 family glycosyltransferase|uniref:Glycosyltransferase family 2 protein n=1 Tax=Candidatus Accumulibacter meliphilus TaxID=2211374 RepID=A0A369XTA9_9PROT|nr:MAG: glycosyltransferase family 2 protein [Candidatus Accumulibacter meliphilus]
MSPRLCAVIVTYGQRYTLLNQVIQRLDDARVTSIVVVFNGNHAPEHISLRSTVVPVLLPINLGSAGGYLAGIEAALLLDATHFLLLDDDNLPEPTCVDRLFQAHAKLGGGSLLALQAFRPSQPWQRVVVREGVLPVGRPNSYGWFHFANERHLLRRQLGAGEAGCDVDRVPENACPRIDVAAYGGLFLRREALQLSERPDPRYFCYYDDFDFTDRLVHRGMTIHLCADAVIDDIETSWHAPNERVHPTFSPHTEEERIYLDLRNAFIFYRSRITNRPLYWLNAVGFWLGIAYLALFRSTHIGTTKRRLTLIRRAVRFGSRGEFAPSDD